MQWRVSINNKHSYVSSIVWQFKRFTTASLIFDIAFTCILIYCTYNGVQCVHNKNLTSPVQPQTYDAQT